LAGEAACRFPVIIEDFLNRHFYLLIDSQNRTTLTFFMKFVKPELPNRNDLHP